MKLVLSFQRVLIREYPLDRPVLSIGRHTDNDTIMITWGSRGDILG